MPSYLINYDLRKPGQNYDGLYEAIKSYPSWAHPLESFWVVVSETASTQIRDNLAKHLDKNDGLIVVKSANSGAWQGLSKDLTDWLKKNL